MGPPLLPTTHLPQPFAPRQGHLPAPRGRCTLVVVNRLDTVVADLRSLPPAKLEMAADYIGRLKRISEEERQTVLARTSGSLSREDADEMEKAIEEGCERIDERDW